MPPKGTGFDCIGWCGWIKNGDGEFVPIHMVDAPPLIPDTVLTDEEAVRLGDYSFTAKIRLSHKTQIEVARRIKAIAKNLKRFNNRVRRFIRTVKRLEEKERRRRLKEEST